MSSEDLIHVALSGHEREVLSRHVSVMVDEEQGFLDVVVVRQLARAASSQPRFVPQHSDFALRVHQIARSGRLEDSVPATPLPTRRR